MAKKIRSRERGNKKELWEIESIIAEFKITIGKLEDTEEGVSQKVQHRTEKINEQKKKSIQKTPDSISSNF